MRNDTTANVRTDDVAQTGEVYLSTLSKTAASGFLDSLKVALKCTVKDGNLFLKCYKMLRPSIPGPPTRLAKEGRLLSAEETHTE